MHFVEKVDGRSISQVDHSIGADIRTEPELYRILRIYRPLL
jgi:hypothetical protein